MRSPRSTNRTLTFALVAVLTCALLIQASPERHFGGEQGSASTFDHLLQVSATASTNGVFIEWRTGFEPNTLGFNVYRVRNGSRAQLNPSLIAGGALIAQRTESYSWFDPQGGADCEYEVETIDVRGVNATHAFASPTWIPILRQRQQSELLVNLGSRGRAAATQKEWPDAIQEKPMSSSSAEDIRAASLSDQWAIANQFALKIGVRANGWYQLTQQQMAAAGFDATGDARNLRLFVSGSEIAMSVSRDSGQLSSTDFIGFWGEGLDTATTDTQVYWLINGTQPGKRIATKGELHTLTNTAQPPSSNNQAAKTPSLFWFRGLAGLIPTPTLPNRNEQSRELIPMTEREPAPNRLTRPSDKDLPSDKVSDSTPVKTGDNDTSPTDSIKTIAAATNLSVPPPTRSTAEKSMPTVKRSRRSWSRRHRRNRSRHLRRRNHPLLAVAAAPAFTYSAQRKDRTVYYSAALNGEQENFFGPVVFGDGPVVTVNLHNIETTATAPAQLQVALQGVSFETHQVKVFINGSLAGSMSFVDETATTQTFTIPISWLVEGDNIVKLAPVGSNHDTSVLDYVRITYSHSFRANDDALQFSMKSTQAARIEGFTTPNIRVLDISDTSAVQEIGPIIEATSGGFAATIPAGGHGKARRLISLPANRLSQPAWLTLNQPSALNHSTNAGNFVIISHKDFIPALAPLVAQRQAQGFNVVVADIEDVFDEFSFGTHTPQAIRDFMSLAKTSWARAPAYLLLVGDASYDPRNYSGAGNFDLVPSKQIDTGVASTATALETASDDWFTDFNGDGIADISVGRLPVRTAAEANLIVSKIVNYSPANTPQSALLVADAQGGYYFNFEAADDQVGAALPASMAIQKVYRRLQPSDADARANIISNFNSGQAVTVYSGHGNVNIWGGSIFSSNDAAALTNGNRLPFVVVMDCLNGFFADPTLQSLAESLIKAPSGGAVASFASSGLTIPDGQHAMGLRMFQLLYGGTSIPIGDASRQAKLATNDMDVRRTWILFGDPSMKIR